MPRPALLAAILATSFASFALAGPNVWHDPDDDQTVQNEEVLLARCRDLSTEVLSFSQEVVGNDLVVRLTLADLEGRPECTTLQGALGEMSQVRIIERAWRVRYTDEWNWPGPSRIDLHYSDHFHYEPRLRSWSTISTPQGTVNHGWAVLDGDQVIWTVPLTGTVSNALGPSPYDFHGRVWNEVAASTITRLDDTWVAWPLGYEYRLIDGVVPTGVRT